MHKYNVLLIIFEDSSGDVEPCSGESSGDIGSGSGRYSID